MANIDSVFPIKANELPSMSSPTRFIVGREDGRYGSMPYGSLPGIDEAKAAAEAAAAQAALFDGPWLDDAAAVLADTSMTYTGGSPSSVVDGDYVRTRAEGFSYLVAASGATNHHVTTAGGVKLYVLAGERGINVLACGAVADGLTDCAVAFQTAVDASLEVYIPAGEYLIDGGIIELRSGSVICGAGIDVTTIYGIRDATASAGTFYANSGSSASTLGGITLRDFTVDGRVETLLFSEFRHLISLNGVRGAMIDCVRVKGFRGDGILIGSGIFAGDERHNYDVTVKNCIIDGTNNDNRNGISVIDCDGIRILNNEFVNCTRNTMPGAIDFEPDAAVFHVIRNALVSGNKFKNCGGNFGTIGVLVPSSVTVEPTNFAITNNVIEVGSVKPQSGAGLILAWSLPGRAVSATSINHNIRVTNNTVIGGETGNRHNPFVLWNAKNVRFLGNTYIDTTGDAYVGFNAGETVRDVVISDTFIRCGTTQKQGIQIFNAVDLSLKGCVFTDCADGVDPAAAIFFNTGSSSEINISDCVFSSPTGRTVRGILKDASHTLSPSTNKFYRNRLGNLLNQFEADEADTTWSSYTPIVEGGGSAGSGTYTRQYGRWRRIGKQVFFEVEIVQTGHTGTGVIEISLPVQVAASPNNELRPVAILLDGVTSSGGQVGAINPAAAAGGLTGSVRCYSTQTGSITTINVPTGAATYRAAGTYMAQ